MILRSLTYTLITIISLSAVAFADEAPRLFASDGRVAAAVRQRTAAGDSILAPAIEKLRHDADRALKSGPFTVTTKKHAISGIDPHDYVSLAPYFWPNPDKPDGLPYIRHDGKRNPEIREYDAEPFDHMHGNVIILAMGYYFTGNEAYAEHATELLRVFFINDATRMNPNMNHGQLVKGSNGGRGTGLIEASGLLRVVDAIGFLRGSKSWTAADDSAMRNWMGEFVKWMRQSKNGKAEEAAINNHGSWYDAQLVAYLLYLGDEAAAREIVETAKQKRIARQIEPDGSLPLEMKRTKSFSYCCYDLDALTLLADLGRRVNVDLWAYHTSDGRGIRNALDHHIPYAIGEKPWTSEQITGFHGSALEGPIRRAAAALPDGHYDRFLSRISDEKGAERRENLLFSAGGK